ncbi:MAG TPA: hydrogenase iron-sulfur subunit, partial [Firmicutes bacterium]|nr:hydrogenase iron-sulfur subunit [Bacillota bacterium]
SGNYFARRRLQLASRFLPFLGIDPRRLRVSWISASEGQKFAETVRELTEQIRALGPNRAMRDEP